MKNFLIRIFLPLLLWVSLFSSGFTQARINIEWLNGPEANEISRSPETFWTNQNELIIIDQEKYSAERIIEVYNPSDKQRHALFDYEMVIFQLKNILNNDITELPVPELIDANGENILFVIEDDLFLYLSNYKEVRRLTENVIPEESPAFSPDGKKLAWSMGNNLYYYDLESDKLEQITFDGSENILNATLSWVYWEEIFGRENTALWWSEQSDAIAFLKTDQSMVDNVIHQNLLPQVPETINQKYPKAGTRNPVVIPAIYDLHRDSVITINTGDHAYEYIVRVKWLPDGRNLSFQTLNRIQKKLNLLFADRLTGETEIILSERDDSWINIHDNLYFLKKDRFIWSSERTGYAHLYLYDFNGNLINQITSGEWSLNSTGSGISYYKNSIVHVDEKAEIIYFAGNKKSHLENHIYSIASNGKKMRGLTTEKEGDHQVRFSKDGIWMTDKYSSRSLPPELSVRRVNSDDIEVISRSKSQLIDKLEIQIPQYFTIPARDGLPLSATMIKPHNFDSSGSYPVIFKVYGMPSSPQIVNKWSTSVYWQNILANNGFIVITFDNRSATRVSKKMESTGLGKYPTEDIKDLEDAVKWTKDQNYIDNNRMGIWGWSGGGYFTMAAMTRINAFKAGISVAGVSDWYYYDTKYTEKFMKPPEINRQGYLKSSNLLYAENMHGRIFLIHGTLDDNVHIQNTYAFANELIRAEKQFNMMVYPNRDHSIGDKKARNHLYKAMLDFWDQYLK